LSTERVETLIEELIGAGLIERDEGHTFRLLNLTDQGHAALEDPTLLPEWSALRPAPSRAARPAPAGTARPLADAQPTGEADPLLLEQLMQWRKQKAQSLGLPSFYVLSNATLQALAAAQPASLEALGCVKGIGQQKLSQYGAEVLALIEAAKLNDRS
jgi:ATP-dependent DNA helicase RecQ